MITNFEPSEIVGIIMCKLLENEKIPKTKHKAIINICSTVEYNLLNGRHNITHLDMLTAKIKYVGRMDRGIST